MTHAARWTHTDEDDFEELQELLTEAADHTVRFHINPTTFQIEYKDEEGNVLGKEERKCDPDTDFLNDQDSSPYRIVLLDVE